jgi:hypothetical protein
MDSIAQKAHVGLEIINENCFHGCRMDSTAQAATRVSEIINKLLPRVTHGFYTANSP